MSFSLAQTAFLDAIVTCACVHGRYIRCGLRIAATRSAVFPCCGARNMRIRCAQSSVRLRAQQQQGDGAGAARIASRVMMKRLPRASLPAPLGGE